MKAMVCEMCSGNDFVKTDGMFVCQSCGTKYSPEEAKKMMIEGTVDVKGVVPVDNSATVEKYLQNARRAKSKEDWSEVERYYNLVEQEDPTNIEAIFYSAYGKAKQSLVEGDLFKRQAAFKVLNKSVSVIDDNFDNEKADEQFPMVLKIYVDVVAMKGSSFVYNTTTTVKNGIKTTTDDKDKTYQLFDALYNEMMVTLSNVEKKLTRKDYKMDIVKLFITDEERRVEKKLGIGNFETNTAELKRLYEKMKQLNPDFKAEEKLKELKEAHEIKALNTSKGLGKFCVFIGVLILGAGVFFATDGFWPRNLPLWGVAALGAFILGVGVKKIISSKKKLNEKNK